MRVENAPFLLVRGVLRTCCWTHVLQPVASDGRLGVLSSRALNLEEVLTILDLIVVDVSLLLSGFKVQIASVRSWEMLF